jgi:hypothetical protein
VKYNPAHAMGIPAGSAERSSEWQLSGAPTVRPRLPAGMMTAIYTLFTRYDRRSDGPGSSPIECPCVRGLVRGCVRRTISWTQTRTQHRKYFYKLSITYLLFYFQYSFCTDNQPMELLGETVSRFFYCCCNSLTSCNVYMFDDLTAVN